MTIQLRTSLCLALALCACTEEETTEENGGATVNGGATPPADSACVGYCSYLERCNSCLYDMNNECLDQAGCVALCETDVPELASTCIAGLSACDEDAYTACYDATIGDDDCAQTCVKLEECGECFIDEDTEDCMTLAACAAVCRELTPPAAASCIPTVASCDEIDACYGG